MGPFCANYNFNVAPRSWDLELVQYAVITSFVVMFKLQFIATKDKIHCQHKVMVIFKGFVTMKLCTFPSRLCATRHAIMQKMLLIVVKLAELGIYAP